MIFLLLLAFLFFALATAQSTLIKLYGNDDIVLERYLNSIDICFQREAEKDILGTVFFGDKHIDMEAFETSQSVLSIQKGKEEVTVASQGIRVSMSLGDCILVQPRKHEVLNVNSESTSDLESSSSCFQIVLVPEDNKLDAFDLSKYLDNESTSVRETPFLEAPSSNNITISDFEHHSEEQKNRDNNHFDVDSIRNDDSYALTKEEIELFWKQVNDLLEEPNQIDSKGPISSSTLVSLENSVMDGLADEATIKKLGQALNSIVDYDTLNEGPKAEKPEISMPLLSPASNNSTVSQSSSTNTPHHPPPLPLGHSVVKGQVHLPQERTKSTGELIRGENQSIIARTIGNAIGLLVSKMREHQVIIPGTNSLPVKASSEFIFISVERRNWDLEKRAWCIAILGDILRRRLHYTAEGFQQIIDYLNADACKLIEFDLIFIDSPAVKRISYKPKPYVLRHTVNVSRLRAFPWEANMRAKLGLSPDLSFDSSLLRVLCKMPGLVREARTDYYGHLKRLIKQLCMTNRSIKSLITSLQLLDPSTVYDPPLPITEWHDDSCDRHPLKYILTLSPSYKERGLVARIEEVINHYKDQMAYLPYLETRIKQLSS